MNDWRDRFLDAALQELHGQRPPDLSARVLAALPAAPRAPLPRLQPRPPSRRHWPMVALLLVALLLGFASTWVVGTRTLPARTDVVAIDLQVLAGTVECIEGGLTRRIAAVDDDPPPFVAEPKNRLASAAASTFRLGAFGHLLTEDHTILEVRSMEFTKQHGLIAVSSLTLGVIAGVVTLQTLARTETANAGEVLRMQSTGGEAVALAAENTRLEQRLRQLEQQNEALRTQLLQRDAAPPVAAPATTPAEPPPPPAPEVASLTFDDPKFAAALAKIDWRQIGEVTNEMGPLLARLAEAVSKDGADLPVDLAVQVQQLNAKLLEPVKALLQAGIPGFGPNGSYTHPLVVANSMAASLAAAGHALTPAQQQQLAGLVRSFAAEQQAISEGQHEFSIEQLLAETEMKDRFYKEAGGLLAPDQHGTLYPEGAAAHEGTSLYSTGVLMRVHAEPVAAKDASDYARIVGNKLMDQLGLDEAAAARVRAVVARSVGNADLWRDAASPVETSQAHFLRTGRTKAAMKAQVEWMRALQREAGLSPEQMQKLRRSSRVLVPLPR